MLSCTKGCCWCCDTLADLGGSARARESTSGSSALRLPCWLKYKPFSVVLRFHINRITYQRTLRDFRRKRFLMTSKMFRGSAAVPREGMVKADTADMLGEWARSPSPTRRQRLSKRESKLEGRQASGHKPSEILLVLRFLFFVLLLFFVARYHVLGLYDLADLAHMLLLLRSSKTADVRPPAIPNYRRALAEHLQTPRQQTPSAPAAPAARSARSLAVRADTLWYGDAPFDVGAGVGAAVAIDGVVKLESMLAGGLKV